MLYKYFVFAGIGPPLRQNYADVSCFDTGVSFMLWTARYNRHMTLLFVHSEHNIICNKCMIQNDSVKRSDVTGSPFEWQLGETMLYRVYKTPLHILHCISKLSENIAGQGY